MDKKHLCSSDHVKTKYFIFSGVFREKLVQKREARTIAYSNSLQFTSFLCNFRNLCLILITFNYLSMFDYSLELTDKLSLNSEKG